MNKNKKKKKYNGFVIRNFEFKGVKYIYGNTFETTSKDLYENLINIKRIK